MRPTLITIISLCLLSMLLSPGCSSVTREEGPRLSVMTWNIYHGGQEHWGLDGLQRVIDIIAREKVDIVLMQEAYQSNMLIPGMLEKSTGVKWHRQSNGEKDNLAIYSRYPLLNDISAWKRFYCNGAVVELEEGHRILVYDTWINSAPDVCSPHYWIKSSDKPSVLNKRWRLRDYAGGQTRAASQLEQQEQGRLKSLNSIIESASEKRAAEKLPETMPVIWGGDFNSPSHLDFTQRNIDAVFNRMRGNTFAPRVVYNPPVSSRMAELGYQDSFRVVHPDERRSLGTTFGFDPKGGNPVRQRIDRIYYKGAGLQPVESRVIGEHPVNGENLFPSDHAAVVTVFRITQR